MKNTILLTGSCGFIGAFVAKQLLEQGYQVVGIDNLNDYYDVSLKNHRLENLLLNSSFTFYHSDIEDRLTLKNIFEKHKFDCVINLAARAGVRYSMINPMIYMTTNAIGTLNLLEFMKDYNVRKMVLASTSSLYAGQKMPFDETLAVNTPISPYAASKKAAEAMTYSFHYLYDLDISVVRYFTVYGPAGRPDMCMFRFIKWIDEGSPIELFGDGSQSRDFTYVTDIADGTIKAMKHVGYEIINLGGGNRPCPINFVISEIEKHLKKKAVIKHLPFHKADILETWANIQKANDLLGWQPTITLEEGIKNTVDWYIANKSWVKTVKM